MKNIDFRRDLIEACKRGDRIAQKKLYTDYADAMYNICYRMIQHEGDAEDILQNSFIDVFNNLEKFKFESTPGSWIKRIVINNCITYFRKKRIHLEEMNEAEEYIDEAEIPESALTVNEVKHAVSKLPDGYRAVVTMYLFEGYDHAEIAQILGITVSTSKTQYFRAKQKLRNLLNKELNKSVI